MLKSESMFLEEVLARLTNGETVYIFDEYEEAVFKFVPIGGHVDAYIRRSQCREHQISWTSDIAFEARLGGQFITEQDYKKY